MITHGQGRQLPFTTHDAVVPVLAKVHVAFAGLALAGEQDAMQTVPTAVLAQLVGQVPLPVMVPVRVVGAVVHTASKPTSSSRCSSRLCCCRSQGFGCTSECFSHRALAGAAYGNHNRSFSSVSASNGTPVIMVPCSNPVTSAKACCSHLLLSRGTYLLVAGPVFTR
jgi:hypothetical protein